jgi:hypothetical protein
MSVNPYDPLLTTPRVYVASSWRNPSQPSVCEMLRTYGYNVFDFRHPAPGSHGFHWSEIDEAWKTWTPRQFREALSDPRAKAGLRSDMLGLQFANVVVLVQPCGRSSHLELGFGIGMRKVTIVYFPDEAAPMEPELMLGMVGEIAIGQAELLSALEAIR